MSLLIAFRCNISYYVQYTCEFKFDIVYTYGMNLQDLRPQGT